MSGGWDIDRAQLAALAKVQPRSAAGVSFYVKFALFAVLGLTGVGGVLFPSLFLGLAFSYTVIMLMFGLTLLNYFTTVLLDTSGNRILLHLPISGRTLLAARILCIAKYAGLLALAISLPTAVSLAVRFGAFALLMFVFSLVLTLIFIIALTLAICWLALRYVDPARIRQGILYFETALFVLAIYAATAVLNANTPLAQSVPDVSEAAWWYLYPAGWMAGLLDYALMEQTHFNGMLATIAVLAPLAGLLGCILLFAGERFTALLSRLEVVPGSSVAKSSGRPRWLARIPARMTKDIQQRAVFDLTSKLMKSDQQLQLTTYPYLGTILVNLGFIVVQFRDRDMRDLPLTAEITFLACYYLPLVLAIIAPSIQYGVEWRAAWCYQVLPFSRPGVVISGAMQAYIWKYILPVYVLLFGVSAAVWGSVAALDVLFAGAVATLICIQRFWSAAPVIPYSTEAGGGGSRLAFIPIAIGLIASHVVLKHVAGNWGVAAGIVALAGTIVAAYSKLRVMDRKDVEAPDRHIGWHRPPS